MGRHITMQCGGGEDFVTVTMEKKSDIDNRRGMSLRRKLSISFVLVAVLPLLLMIAVTFRQSEVAVTQAAFDRNRDLAASIAIMMVAAALAGLIGLIIARALSQPIAEISKAASRLAHGDMTTRIEVDSRDELGKLAETFNFMSRQIRNRDEALRESEERYRSLVDNLKIGVYRSLTGFPGRFVQANPAMASIFGYDSVEEFMQQEVGSLFQKVGDRSAFIQELTQHGVLKDRELALRKKDGTPIWCSYNVAAHYDEQGNIDWIDGVLENVTERKLTERLQMALYRISETAVTANTPEGLYHAFHELVSEFMPAKQFFIALRDESDQPLKIVFNTCADGECLPGGCLNEELFEAIALTGEPQLGEESMPGSGAKAFLGVPLKTADNWVMGVMLLLGDAGGPQFTGSHLESLIFLSNQMASAMERKKAEENLRFVSLHDALTGLYNRGYFEEEMKRLDRRRKGSVGVIICDVDGLKMVNDTLGHEQGDKILTVAAGILAGSFRDGDVVARIGGDEFAIVLEETSEELVKQARDRIRIEIEAVNMEHGSTADIPLSLSIGYAIGSGPETTMRELYRQADNAMYREKLHRGQSIRSAIVQTILRLLKARDLITEGHSDRLQYLVSYLGKEQGLSEAKISELCLLAQFHDIGKVGIPDRILMKQGPLTLEEMLEMQRHCDIGRRIAGASPDLEPIGDWILKHQEWWNGGGYPLGLSGEQIPLESRILAIADAYDAMTNDRPYRLAMSHEEAIAELNRCAGTQFDPILVKSFQTIVL